MFFCEWIYACLYKLDLCLGPGTSWVQSPPVHVSCYATILELAMPPGASTQNKSLMLVGLYCPTGRRSIPVLVLLILFPKTRFTVDSWFYGITSFSGSPAWFLRDDACMQNKRCARTCARWTFGRQIRLHLQDAENIWQFSRAAISTLDAMQFWIISIPRRPCNSSPSFCTQSSYSIGIYTCLRFCDAKAHVLGWKPNSLGIYTNVSRSTGKDRPNRARREGNYARITQKSHTWSKYACNLEAI
jgi:hypothetical protein